MKICTRSSEAMALVRSGGSRPRVLVPTMGALHRGHLELLQQGRSAAGPEGELVASIFVNPLQFEPGADLERYPRPEEEDEKLCREAGVDLLFRPGPSEMYAPDRSVYVEEVSLSQTLCGRSRPGHFRGVCTVVTKLFHILAPEIAIFGEKDFQQLAIIRRLVRDLDFPIEIIGVPTVREADGLACSSRNQYLTTAERAQAPILRQALLDAAKAARAGETSPAKILEVAQARLAQADLARLDYLELVDGETLQPAAAAGPGVVLAVAAFFGKTRLIDNIRI